MKRKSNSSFETTLNENRDNSRRRGRLEQEITSAAKKDAYEFVGNNNDDERFHCKNQYNNRRDYDDDENKGNNDANNVLLSRLENAERTRSHLLTLMEAHSLRYSEAEHRVYCALCTEEGEDGGGDNDDDDGGGDDDDGEDDESNEAIVDNKNSYLVVDCVEMPASAISKLLLGFDDDDHSGEAAHAMANHSRSQRKGGEEEGQGDEEKELTNESQVGFLREIQLSDLVEHINSVRHLSALELWHGVLAPTNINVSSAISLSVEDDDEDEDESSLSGEDEHHRLNVADRNRGAGLRKATGKRKRNGSHHNDARSGGRDEGEEAKENDPGTSTTRAGQYGRQQTTQHLMAMGHHHHDSENNDARLVSSQQQNGDDDNDINNNNGGGGGAGSGGMNSTAASSFYQHLLVEINNLPCLLSHAVIFPDGMFGRGTTLFDTTTQLLLLPNEIGAIQLFANHRYLTVEMELPLTSSRPAAEVAPPLFRRTRRETPRENVLRRLPHVESSCLPACSAMTTTRDSATSPPSNHHHAASFPSSILLPSMTVADPLPATTTAAAVYSYGDDEYYAVTNYSNNSRTESRGGGGVGRADTKLIARRKQRLSHLQAKRLRLLGHLSPTADLEASSARMRKLDRQIKSEVRKLEKIVKLRKIRRSSIVNFLHANPSSFSSSATRGQQEDGAAESGVDPSSGEMNIGLTSTSATSTRTVAYSGLYPSEAQEVLEGLNRRIHIEAVSKAS